LTYGPSRPIRQLYLGPNNTPDTFRNNIACAYRASQNIGERVAGRNLGLNQIYDSRNNLSNADPDNAANYAVWATGSNFDGIATEAMQQLGIPNYRAIEVNSAEEADFSLRLVNNLAGNPGHYQVGDNNGGFLWDPYFENVDPGRDVRGITYISIQRERVGYIYGPNGAEEVRVWEDADLPE
jgi:hypothetical protein